jgi:putative ABC transport system substrate-binding protein
MRRREFIALLGAAAAWPVAPHAQQVGKAHRIGLVFATSPVSDMVGSDPIHPLARAFVHGLRDLGYVEGCNLVLERRSAEGRFERSPEIMRELIASNVDVIVSSNNVITEAAKSVTRTIPIVMPAAGDPVGTGLVTSLARPGGNITGFSLSVGNDVAGKRLQLIKELLPKASRVAWLRPIAGYRDTPAEGWQLIEGAGRELGVTLLLAEHTPTDFADAFALIRRERPDAVLVSLSSGSYQNRKSIVEFVAHQRLPAMYSSADFMDTGGLISYGAEMADLFRRAAGYVDKILKGTRPGDLPIEQPTKFELKINLKTARALGLTIPPSLLARADEVIE